MACDANPAVEIPAGPSRTRIALSRVGSNSVRDWPARRERQRASTTSVGETVEDYYRSGLLFSNELTYRKVALSTLPPGLCLLW